MILDYDFPIKYVSTNKIGQANIESRLMDSYRKQPKDNVVAAVSVGPEVITV